MSFNAPPDVNDFWGYADAGYRGPSKAIKAFHAAKQLMAFKASSHAVFAADHSHAMKHLRTVLNNIVTPRYRSKAGVLMSDDRFKCDNVLFLVRAAVQVDTRLSSNLSAQPVNYDEAADSTNGDANGEDLNITGRG